MTTEEITEEVSRRGRPKGSKNKPRTPEKVVSPGKVERVPLSLINVEDDTFKFRVKLRLGNLPESIEENGQQFPVLLRRVPGEGRFQLISGFRRVTALQKLRWSHVNAIIREDLDDDVEAVRVSVIENEIRQTYNDLDRAYAILAYRRMGKTTAEIGELFKVGKRQVQRLQKLVNFPEELQDAVADGSVSSTNAVRLMQHIDQHPEADLSAWIARIKEGELTYTQLNKALKEEAAQDKGDTPVEFYVPREKDGKKSLRIRPISISEDMNEDQRKKLIKDLQAVLKFVKALPNPE